MKTAIVRLCCVLFVGFACVALPPTGSAQAPAASPAPSPAKKRQMSITTTFRGNIETVDAGAKSFTVKGKKATRTFKVTATTTLLKRAGGNASFDDLKAGDYVTGSGKKTGETQVDVVSMKVGPKGSGPASKKKSAKKTPAAPSPSAAQ